MTFTVVARCPRTGRLGVGTATHSPTVGLRVPFVKPLAGAVAIMAVADQRLGPIALNFLELGYKAPGAIAALVQADDYPEYRQLGIVDDDGIAAARTGAMNKPWCGDRVGEGYVALGNALSGEQVVEAMERAFLAEPDEDLEERLLRAIEAGRDAGGQPEGQRSAALVVYAHKTFARVDLASTCTTSRSANCAASSTGTAPPSPTTTSVRLTRACRGWTTGWHSAGRNASAADQLANRPGAEAVGLA